MGSNLWSWQRTQPSVCPRIATPILLTCESMWSASILALSGLTISMSPTIKNPVATILSAFSSGEAAGIRSPAICSRTNSSNGLSVLKARIR